MAQEIENLQRRLQSIEDQFEEIEQAYQTLQSSFSQIEAIYDFATALSIVVEFDDLLTFIKETFVGAFAMDAVSLHLIEKNDRKLISKFSVGPAIKQLKCTLESKIWQPIVHFEKSKTPLYFPKLPEELRAKVGTCSLLTLPLFVGEDKLVGMITLFRNSKDAFAAPERNFLIKLTRQLAIAIDKVLLFEFTREMSLTDELTGIYNRRYFAQRYEREVQRAARYNHSISVVMLDIDKFKHYNDTNGHLKGDQVISRVAALLESELRKTDILARYGGEEFVIILPETGSKQARIVAEKLRRRIESEDFAGQESQPGGQVTISLGLASFPEDASTSEILLQLADEALYAAKESGRNRVATADAKNNDSSKAA